MKSSNLNKVSKLSLTSTVAVLILIFTACSDTVQRVSEPMNGSDDFRIGHSIDGNAANFKCHSVSGALDWAGNPNVVSGTISGDVEGTVINTAEPLEVHGNASFSFVEQEWQISGGIINSLINNTLILNNDFVGVNAQPARVRINTRARVVEGAQKGKLTLNGWADFSGPTVHLNYYGVICP